MKKFLMALILAGGLSSPLLAQQANLPPEEFQHAIADKNVQVLDVRTAGEFQGGYLKNAMQANWNDQAEFIKRVASLDKARPVYTYCLSGGRSNAAATWLNEHGYKAYNLSGGMMAWKKAGKPVEEITLVPQMNEEEYLKLTNAHKTVLVDFGAGWCPPCIKMAPVLDSLVKANPGKFSLVKIDGAAQATLAARMNVTAFPVFIVYKNGKEAWRQEGIVEAAELMKQL